MESASIVKVIEQRGRQKSCLLRHFFPLAIFSLNGYNVIYKKEKDINYIVMGGKL